MHPVPRTAPGVARTRSTAVLAVLAAVLLALLTACATGGPRPGPVGPAPVGAATVGAVVADHHRDIAPRADDAYTAVGITQAAPRHEFRGERPTPPGHPATVARASAVIPPGPARAPPSSDPSPPSPGGTAHDRERAPPAPSGI